MQQVSVDELGRDVDALIERVSSGDEEILMTCGGRAVVQLVPISQQSAGCRVVKPLEFGAEG